MMQSGRASAEKPTIIQLEDVNYVDSSLRVIKGSVLAKPIPLFERMDLKTQEVLIMHDILPALLGCEGSYIRFSDRFNPALLHDRIHGPDHKVAKLLDVSLKTPTKKLLRFGKQYFGLSAFAAIYNHPLFGKVNHRLCHLIRVLLDLYRQLVVHLEKLHVTSPTFSLRTMDNELSEHFADKFRHLHDIVCSIHALTEDRKPSFVNASAVPETITFDLAGQGAKFDLFLESVKSDIRLHDTAGISSDVEPFPVCKGGLTLRIVQNRIYQFKGDPVSSHFLAGLFETISQDYLQFLNSWLAYGEIKDTYSDFFIKRNDIPKNFFYSNMEKYWQEIYVVKRDGMLDQFENQELQAKILLTGKYLNIFRKSTNNTSLDSLPKSVANFPAPSPIESLFSTDLTLKISQFYNRANRLLLKLLFEGYYLNEILQSLHQTFFLANSFKVDNFMSKKLNDLCRGKTASSAVAPTIAFNEIVMTRDDLWEIVSMQDDVSTFNIEIDKVLRQFEKFSIDAKSFYEIAGEILSIRSFDAEELIPANENASVAIRRIVTQSLQKRPDLSETEKLVPAESFEEAVIAGVNIDIRLPFPLNLILSENLLFECQLMFKFQMMLKFTSKFLDSAWLSSGASTVWRHKSHSRSVQKLILRGRILISRMKNFINVLENHVSFSIVDANFSTLKSQAKKCQQWVNESRPESAGGIPSSSNFMSEDTQFLMSHGSTNNDVFEEKISKNAKASRVGLNQTESTAANDVLALVDKIGLYLSNTLRDLMITDANLLLCIRTLLNEIVDYASTISRLKRSLILMNEILLRDYSRNYPEKFGKIEFNENLLNQRITRLNEVMTYNWSRFNDSVGSFTQVLQNCGAENPAMQTLAEKLALV